MSAVRCSFQLTEQRENREVPGYQPLPHKEIFRELYGIALGCFLCRPADGESAKVTKTASKSKLFPVAVHRRGQFMFSCAVIYAVWFSSFPDSNKVLILIGFQEIVGDAASAVALECRDISLVERQRE